MTAIILPWPPASLSGHAKGHWSKRELAALRSAYAATAMPDVSAISAMLGRSKSAIRNQAYKLGITVRDDNWSDADVGLLRKAYQAAVRRGDLAHLSGALRRPKTAISQKARSLGLTDRCRPVADPKNSKPPKPRKYATDAERSAARAAAMVARHESTPHPMIGKKHPPHVRAKIAAKSRAAWRSKSEAERGDWTSAMLKARLVSQGTLAPPRHGASWKAGWREIGAKRNYYRSRWEANYARYLQFLKERGEIADWAHEPETFWFDGIKRGVRSYLPDFRVTENDGSSKLHEVKGWMDSRSKTTLRRMAKYHPGETIILIREREYNAIARQLGRLIEGWESSNRSDRP